MDPKKKSVFKKFLNRYTILVIFACYLFSYMYLNHTATNTNINNIEQLAGKTITSSEIKKKLKKSIRLIKKDAEIKKFADYMGISVPENSIVYRISGKGLPYYYGAIVLDTLNNKVIDIEIKKLN